MQSKQQQAATAALNLRKMKANGLQVATAEIATSGEKQPLPPCWVPRFIAGQAERLVAAA